jgi:hypothetical protein
MSLREVNKWAWKVSRSFVVWIIVSNLIGVWLLGILDRAMLWKWQNSHVLWIDLFTRIHEKLRLQFWDAYTVFYKLWNFTEYLNWIKWISKLKKVASATRSNPTHKLMPSRPVAYGAAQAKKAEWSTVDGPCQPMRRDAAGTRSPRTRPTRWLTHRRLLGNLGGRKLMDQAPTQRVSLARQGHQGGGLAEQRGDGETGILTRWWLSMTEKGARGGQRWLNGTLKRLGR